MFHDYHYMISLHKRAFELYKKQAGATNSNTARYETGTHTGPFSCEGVFETVTHKELKAIADGEHIEADMKLLTTPTLLAGQTVDLKDKIIYSGRTFFVTKIRDDEYYGNYFIIYLKKEEGNV